jgi:hypothetical protein
MDAGQALGMRDGMLAKLCSSCTLAGLAGMRKDSPSSRKQRGELDEASMSMMFTRSSGIRVVRMVVMAFLQDQHRVLHRRGDVKEEPDPLRNLRRHVVTGSEPAVLRPRIVHGRELASESSEAHETLPPKK